jgi:glyoxylase-like metal-dependent hydrolase (beta-lactamase superfamily II)/Tfp pilus assembly protein PilF
MILIVYMFMIFKGFGYCKKDSGSDKFGSYQKFIIADKSFKKGHRAFYDGYYKKSEKEFEKALNIYPFHANSYFYLAKIFYKKTDYYKSIEYIKKAKKSFPHMVKIIDTLIKEKHNIMRKIELKGIERYLEKKAERSGSCIVHNIREAISDTRKQIASIGTENTTIVNPRYTLLAEYEYFHGNILFKLKKYDLARDQYLEAIRINSSHKHAYNNLVSLYYKSKKYQVALDYLNQATVSGVNIKPALKKAVLKELGNQITDIMEKEFPGGVHLFIVNVGDHKDPFYENTYVVYNKETRDAVIVDPGAIDKRIEKYINSKGLRIHKILNTHGHYDHIGANRYFADLYGVKITAHEADLSFYYSQHKKNKPDEIFSKDQLLKVKNLSIQILHTPGHTKGSVCFLINNNLFSGDTLFKGSIGNVSGKLNTERNKKIKEMIYAINNKLLSLPESTCVFPGHGLSTTIGVEREENPFLK